MANEDNLMKATQVHSPAQHADVLPAINGIQSSHRFVPEQRFVTNALNLPHVENGDPQVDCFIDQNELPARKLIHEAPTVRMGLVGLTNSQAGLLTVLI